MEQNSFIKNGLKFECQRCSSCCGKTPGFVYLSKQDLFKLCDFFKLNIEEFINKYCRWANYYYGQTVLALKEEKDYYCTLWNNGCTAYEARPIQCSTYPFWTWMINDKETWTECAKDCPGINNGKIHSCEEILKNSNDYTNNIPITKEECEVLINLEINQDS